MGQTRGSDRIDKTQLVNDRALAKERLKRANYVVGSNRSEKNGNSIRSAVGSLRDNEYQSLPQRHPPDRKERKIELRSENKNEPTIGTSLISSAELATNTALRHQDAYTSRSGSAVTSHSVSKPSTAVDSGKTPIINVERSEPEKCFPSGRPQSASRQKSWYTALKEKQRKLREEQKTRGDTGVENDVNKGNVGDEGMDAIVSIFGK
eukprot:5780369-Ditylum_brightwellii.AAC.1